MTLLFIDGFDTYRSSAGTFTQDQLSTNWLLGSQTDYVTTGVVGGGYQHVTGSGANSGLLHTLPSGHATLGVGFHVYNTAAPTATTSGIAVIYNSAGTAVFTLTQEVGGLLGARAGTTSSTLLSSSAAPLPTSVFSHLEIKLVNNGGASSTYEVRRGGSTVLSGTFTLSTDLARVRLGDKPSGGGTFPTYTYDNFFIWNSAGSVNNNWQGERNVYTILPDGDGTDADWTLSTGTDGFALIDNVPATDSTYILSDLAGEVSSFDLSALPTTDISILGVQLSVRAWKTGTATGEIAAAPTGFTGSTTPVSLLQDSVTISHFIFEENPDTTDPWDPAEVNNLEVQIERTT